jgi:hypothetical protein
MSTCRSCNADIIWVTTKAGRNMPVDAQPNPNGNVELLPAADGRSYYAGIHSNRPIVPTTLYMPHHATCPQGSQWRK